MVSFGVLLARPKRDHFCILLADPVSRPAGSWLLAQPPDQSGSPLATGRHTAL